MTDQAGAAPPRKFDPTKHLRQLKGKGGVTDYLDVRWRLVWLRTEHPDAVITTEHIQIDDTIAIFKAFVAIPGEGGGSATGYGSETPRDFGDYVEKAETKSLGRALIALGYGTAYVPDEDDQPRRGGGTPASSAPRPAAPPAGAPASGGGDRLSDRQRQFIRVLGREWGHDDASLDDLAVDRYQHPVDELSRRDASAFIEWLRERRDGDA